MRETQGTQTQLSSWSKTLTAGKVKNSVWGLGSLLLMPAHSRGHITRNRGERPRGLRRWRGSLRDHRRLRKNGTVGALLLQNDAPGSFFALAPMCQLQPFSFGVHNLKESRDEGGDLLFRKSRQKRPPCVPKTS
jgi:hypothetical protein